MHNNYFKNKKVLITGGAGLLGVSLTKLLISLNAKVFSTYYKRLPPEKYLKYYVKYDFNNFSECLKATENIDYVIISSVQASGVKGLMESPTKSILPNLKIHAGLFEACAQNKVKKVVWVSSSSVYQVSNYPISEDGIKILKWVQGFEFVLFFLVCFSASTFKNRQAINNVFPLYSQIGGFT